MDVAPPFARDQLLDPHARFVVIAAVLSHFGAVGAHSGVLVRVIPDGNEDSAFHAVHAAREGDRLAVIAGARADDPSAAIIGRELREQIQSTANLEGAGGIVVLVLDPRLAPKPLLQEGMPQQRRAMHDGVDTRARVEHVLQRRPQRRISHSPWRFVWRGTRCGRGPRDPACC